MHVTIRLALGVALPLAAASAQELMTVEVGKITRLQGTMANHLTGIGLITGLNGTGGGDSASRIAAQNFIRNHDLNISESQLTTGSFTLVAVNATLPPFAKEGATISVTVSTMSDAVSLFGGVLQYAALRGPDGETYVTAAGKVSVHGWSAQARGNSATRNHVTAATIANGGLVVKAPRSYFLSEMGHLELRLINPSLRTAQNITDAVNPVLKGTGCVATVVDRSLVQIQLPKSLQDEQDQGAIRVLGLVRPLRVVPEHPSTVVIDPAAGTIVAGGDVMISPCVVALSDLTVTITSDDEVSQPFPGPNLGTTEIVNRTRIEVAVDNTEPKPVKGGATVGELVANLRSLQLPPRQLIQVFEHLRDQGYLHAELVVR